MNMAHLHCDEVFDTALMEHPMLFSFPQQAVARGVCSIEQGSIVQLEQSFVVTRGC